MAGELEAVATDISAVFSTGTAAMGSAAALAAAQTMVKAVHISTEKASSKHSSPGDRVQWQGAIDANFQALGSMLECAGTLDDAAGTEKGETSGALKKVGDLAAFYDSLISKDGGAGKVGSSREIDTAYSVVHYRIL